MSSLAHRLILGLTFLKLTKSKIDFKTHKVEIGSKMYSADIHCITSSNSTIIIPTFGIYRRCQLLRSKRVCRMVIFTLITVVVLTAIASHTHCHFKPSFKKQEESFALPPPNLTSKGLLAYSRSFGFTVRSQPVKSKKTHQLYLLDPLHHQNITLIKTVTHAHCRFVIRDKEHPGSPIKGPNKIPWGPSIP